MNINHHYKYYFIHISKTAGTSWRQAFSRSLGSDKVLFTSSGNQLALLESTNLEPIKMIGGHIPYHMFQRSSNAKQFQWQKFCIVRNPIDRLISLYNYLSVSSHEDHRCFQNLSFSEFCEFYRSNQRPDLSMCYYFHPSGLFDATRQVIKEEKIAVYSLDNMNDLKRVLESNLQVRLKIKHLNKSRKKVKIKNIDDINLDFLGEEQKLYLAVQNKEFSVLK